MQESIELSTQLKKSDGKLWGWFMPIDDAIVQNINELGWKRLVANIENAEPMYCAIVSIGNGVKGITLNRPFVKKNGFLLDQELKLKLVEDRSKYGMPLSEEFEATLESDPEAQEHFNSLTPGKQRNLIYFADNVKASDIRIRRALVVMNHLKIHRGKIDFKALTHEMKEANNREKLS